LTFLVILIRNKSDELLRRLEIFKERKYSKIIGETREDAQQNIDIDIDVEENDKISDDQEESPAFDEVVNKHRKFKLLGHTDSIFGISISNDKKFILSCSFDESIRLWSIYTRSTLVVYKGHFSPVLCIKFSPFKYYFHITLNTVIISHQVEATKPRSFGG